MDELVHRWSDRMLVDVAEPLPNAVLESGSLLRPPAPDSVIDQAEARLGVNLPESYRSFLSISDGAHADFEVVPASEPRSDSSDPTFGLVPASELSMLSDVLPDVVESLAQISELPNLKPKGCAMPFSCQASPGSAASTSYALPPPR